MISVEVVSARLTWIGVLALALGCGPAVSSWDDWDFAFLSAERSGAAGDPRKLLMLGSSVDGRTMPMEPARAASSTAIAWSPSGDAIAYMDMIDDETANDPSLYEGLWVARPEGRELFAHLHVSFEHAQASELVEWSPDGRWIAVGMPTFVSVGLAGENWHMFVIDLDEELDARVQEDWSHAEQISWAPDGSRYVGEVADVTYDADYQPIDGPRRLYTYDLASEQRTWLEVDTAADEHSPAWSPDGDSIAYVTDATGAEEIQRWPVAGGAPRRVGPTPCAVMSLQWLVDDTQLLVDCWHELAVVDAEDGTVLAQHEGTAAAPSPDGARVLFEHDSTIHVLELASGDVTAIGPGEAPVWRPLVVP